MGKRLTEQEQRECMLEYEAGSTAKKLAAKYGVSAHAIYKLAQRSKDKDEEIDVDEVGEEELVYEEEPKMVAAGGGAAPRAAAQSRPVPQPRLIPVPLFPNSKSNQFDRIKLFRIIAKPMSAGTGYIQEFDPYVEESTIAELYGGGRYDVRGFNAQGQELGRKVIVLNGRSKPISTEEDDEANEVTPIFPSIGGRGGNSMQDVGNLMRQMQETTKAQLQQMQENSDRAIAQARDQSMLQIKMIQDASDARARQDQMFFENMMKLNQANARKEDSLKDKLEEYRLIKELAGDGDGDKKDALTTALEKMPEMISAASNLIHGPADFDEEFEGEEEGGEDVVAPEQEPVKPIREIANDLFRNLVAQGMPPEEAKAMVLGGLGILKQQVESKKKSIQAAKPKAKAPAPRPKKPEKKEEVVTKVERPQKKAKPQPKKAAAPEVDAKGAAA